MEFPFAFDILFSCKSCSSMVLAVRRYFSLNLWLVEQTYVNNGVFYQAANLDRMSILYTTLAKMQP